MTRPFLAQTAIVVLFFAALLSILSWIEATGVLPDRTSTLWGQAIALAEGEGAFKTFITSFPPLPLWLSVGAQSALPGEGAAGPMLLSAALGALLAAQRLAGLRRVGFGRATALAATALIIFNPIALVALAAGPGGTLLLIGACGLGAGLFALRRDADPPSIMKASFALGLTAFSHPLGLALALACLPFAFLSAPPGMVGRSASGFFLALFFPVVFGVLSFGYVNWINGEPAWLFLTNVMGLASAAVSWGDAAQILWALPAGAVLLGLSFAARRRAPIAVASLALWGLGSTVPLLAFALGMAEGATLALAPLLGFSAAALVRWPPSRLRAASALAVLTLAAGGGALATFSDMTPSRLSLLQAPSPSPHAALGTFLRGRHDVLIDAATFPAIVAGRGSARGLITPADPRFGFALLTHRLSTRFIAVRDPAAEDGDAIRRGFPLLFRAGGPNLRLIYDSDGWRVYERAAATLAQEDAP